MGVKTQIFLEDIKPFFNASEISKSIDGVSDSVYFLDDRYILKIFEDMSPKSVNEEIMLLKNLESLRVSKVKSELFYIKNKPALIYDKIEGESLKKAGIVHIKQIARFLKKFHNITKKRKCGNEKLFEKSKLTSLIESTDSRELAGIYESIDIELNNDGVIHGDIFLDNVKFKDDVLSGVYDFSEACEGDFLFDLAVVAFSWCMDDKINEEKLKSLLEAYGADVSKKKFCGYMKYALLYYATTRYLDNRDYKELLKKIENLEGRMND